jgi:hypothetical protein
VLRSVLSGLLPQLGVIILILTLPPIFKLLARWFVVQAMSRSACSFYVQKCLFFYVQKYLFFSDTKSALAKHTHTHIYIYTIGLLIRLP